MSWLLAIPLIVLAAFSFVIIFGAPYLPTLDHQRREALKLLDLKPGQTMLELGSGDGRMLVAAAKEGVKAVGYEINPLLFVYSWLVTRRYRSLVNVRCRNYWKVSLPECDGIYVFLLNKYMAKLNKKITQEISNPVKVVSFAFRIPDKKHITEKSGLYLYEFNNSNSSDLKK